MTSLLPHHQERLRRIGLRDAAIGDAKLRSLGDIETIARPTDWIGQPADDVASGVLIPTRDSDGRSNGRVRLWRDAPRQAGDASVRFEQPADGQSRPYFGPEAVAAFRRPGERLIIIFSHELDVLLAEQTGLSAIGLPFATDWQRWDGFDSVGWQGRPVVIAVPFLPVRDALIDFQACELRRELHERGARTVELRLPPGPCGGDGRPAPMNVGDFIRRHGEQAFHDLVGDALSPVPSARSIDDWRRDMRASRQAIIGKPGVYCDCSPAGVGKTEADIEAAKQAGSALLIAPTHSAAREVEARCKAAGLPAVAMPELTPLTCLDYGTASAAVGAGLPLQSAACGLCAMGPHCEYQRVMKAAKTAAILIATHKRGSLQLDQLTGKRQLVIVDENPLDFLRPTIEISDPGSLGGVGQVWGGVVQWSRRRGKADRERWARRVIEVVEHLQHAMATATVTGEVTLPAPAGSPPLGTDAAALAAAQRLGLQPPPEAMQIARGVATGGFRSLIVRVDPPRTAGGEAGVRRSLMALERVELPGDVPTVLSDATGDANELRQLLPGATNITPPGQIARQHPAIQLPNLDVTRSAAASKVIATVQGVLEAYPRYQRWGVIADQRHLPAIRGTARKGRCLPAAVSGRIAKAAHFRGGESRGSNAWVSECDVILILGTPRVPPGVVHSRLIQTDNPQAADRDGAWGPAWWSAVDTQGNRHTIGGLGYADHDWSQAHRGIVRAELIQSLGRGRGILPEGVPIIVASNEPLGLPVRLDVQALTEAEFAVLHALRELTAETSNRNTAGAGEPEAAAQRPMALNNTLELSAVSTAAVSDRTGKPVRWARELLAALAERGLVNRVGRRGGWRPASLRQTGGPA